MTANKLADKTLVWQAAKSGIAMLVVIVYSRLMGADGRGGLSIWLINIQLFMLVLEWMVGSTIPNFIGEYGFRKVLKFSSLAIAFISLLWLLLGGWIHNGVWFWMCSWEDISAVGLGMCLIVGLGMLNVIQGVFQYRGMVEQRNKLQLRVEIFKLVILLLSLVFFTLIIVHGPWLDLSVWGLIWLAVPILNLGHVLVVLVLATWVAILVTVWMNRSVFVEEWRNDPLQGRTNVTGWILPLVAFRDGFWSQAGHLVYFAITRLPIWWLGFRGGQESVVGVLANVWLMWDTVMIVGNSYGVVIHSMVLQENYGADATLNSGAWLKHFRRNSFWRAILLCFVISSLPDDVYSTVFGPEFGNMNRYFIFLIPVVVLSSVAAPMAHWLHANNRFFELFIVYAKVVSLYGGLLFLGNWMPGFKEKMDALTQAIVSNFLCHRSWFESDSIPIPWEMLALIPAFGCMVFLLRATFRKGNTQPKC